MEKGENALFGVLSLLEGGLGPDVFVIKGFLKMTAYTYTGKATSIFNFPFTC